ncbi:hypothetical protein GME_17417 [Halomonas sp. TD01]|nr:hypothetical protein GME_17417 [Halomonas sp. TD01]
MEGLHQYDTDIGKHGNEDLQLPDKGADGSMLLNIIRGRKGGVAK